ncbi:hypothetical protein GobsT_11470 [Gemmata obscuriglobus]|nr:hypothetical protein GobsT_11470 [Gemmata obscuriglobus]VTS01513.1 unnamed protein product [Gemmata obscuriglobus UQM 2246]
MAVQVSFMFGERGTGGAMAGKLMKRDAIIDLVKSEHRTNARRRREGLTRHPVVGIVCGCTLPDCGGWHAIVTERTIPTEAEADATLATKQAARKASKRARKATVVRKWRKPAEPDTAPDPTA